MSHCHTVTQAQVDSVASLLANQASLDAVTNVGSGCLHVAAQHAAHNCAQLCLNANAAVDLPASGLSVSDSVECDSVDFQDSTGATPLHHACIYADARVAEVCSSTVR